MKKNKGFTIVELLVVIAIMLSILGIVVFSVNKISNVKKEEAYVEIKKEIMTAGKQYFETNEYLFEGLEDGSTGTIPLYYLVEEDYINKVSDPRTGRNLNKCSEIVVTKKNGKYLTKFNENISEKCDILKHNVIIEEPGGPKLSYKFVKEDKNNAIMDAFPINGHDGNKWFNKESLKDVILGANIIPDENKNGPIVKIILQNAAERKEISNQRNGKLGYYDFESYNHDSNNLDVVYTAYNSSGKSAKIISHTKIDTVGPTATIENKYYNKWTKNNVQLKYIGNDNVIDNITGSGVYKWQFKNDDFNDVYDTTDGKKLIWITNDENGYGKDRSIYEYSSNSHAIDNCYASAYNGFVWTRAIDNAGNIGTPSKETIVKIDRKAPDNLIITNPSNEEWTNKSIQLKYNANETESGIDFWEYSYDNVHYFTHPDSFGKLEYINSTNEGNIFNVDRNVTLYVKAHDVVGNVSKIVKTKIKIDKTSPKIEIKNPSNGDWVNHDIQLTYKAVEEGSGINHWEYSYDDIHFFNHSDSFNKLEYSNNTDTGNIYRAEHKGLVYARAIDNVGNVSSSVSTKINIERNFLNLISDTTKNSTASSNGNPAFAAGTTYFYRVNSQPSGFESDTTYSCSERQCYYAKICKNVVSFDINFDLTGISLEKGSAVISDKSTDKTRLSKKSVNGNAYYVYDYSYTSPAGNVSTVRTFEEYSVDCGY